MKQVRPSIVPVLSMPTISDEVPITDDDQSPKGKVSSLRYLPNSAIVTIKAAFGSYTKPGFLDKETFFILCSNYATEQAIESAFAKMDYDNDQIISFGDLVNFIVSEQQSADFIKQSEENLDLFEYMHTQSACSATTHRASISCSAFMAKRKPVLVSGSTDGSIGVWEPDTLQCVRKIEHRSGGSASTSTSSNTVKAGRAVPIISLCILPLSPCVLVGSADCYVTLYDLQVRLSNHFLALTLT